MTKKLIDTNILIRLIAEDIPSQQEISKKLFREIENNKIAGIISILVIHEFINIAVNYYKKEKSEAINYILKLISFKKIEILEIGKSEVIEIIKNCLALNIDFTDAYLLWVGSKENYEISTFDKRILQNM
jgi:predicted nucleic acid-binding protein